MSETLIVRSDRVVLPGGMRAAAVMVRDGRIEQVACRDARPDAAARDIDLGRLALLPGLVDTNVRVSGPDGAGREDFAAVTRAAAAGGVTTICDMPSGPGRGTASVTALRARLDTARGQCAVDVAFWGAAVPGADDQLRPLLEAGVIGFACSLAGTGMPGLPPLGTAELRAAMTALAGPGAPLLVHAEDPAEITVPAGPGYGAFLASRPPAAERRAIEAVVSAAAATGARAHIACLAAAECAALIGAAKAAGIALSAETCPHYLVFAAEEIPDDATEFMCCPPVRYVPNREALWRALGIGVVDGVVSGHVPRVPGPGHGDRTAARSGIASFPVSLPVTWTAARDRGRTLTDIARWMSAFPAALAGLAGKGAIAPGRDADLVAFDPEAACTVRGGGRPHLATPYEGRTLAGRVSRVWLRGREIIPGSTAPGGRLILRPPARGRS